MKKAFIITSAIEVNNNCPLTYSNTRSIFSDEERFRQTIFTISSLDLATDSDTTFYLLDISENDHYAQILSYQKNLKYICVKKEFPEIHKIITTHPQKSHCECLLLSTFLHVYHYELEQYDFLFKMSGRYFLDSSFNFNLCTEENLDKLFFKHFVATTWNDSWGYEMVDRRNEQNDNCVRQYVSILYGWGRNKNDMMLGLLKRIATELNNPGMFHYDVETLAYFYTRPISKDIVETDWRVYGWLGPNGHFIRH